MTGGRLARADRALADAALHLTRHADGGTTEERDDLVLFAGAHAYPGPYCNGAVRLDPSLAAEDAVGRARAFFAPRRRSFILWARDGPDEDLIALARARGWFERPPAEGMPLLLRDADVAEHPDDPVPQPIGSAERAARYLEVVADAYGQAEAPESLQEAIFFSAEAALADEAVALLLDLEGRPAAGAMAVVHDEVACVLWVATANWARGHGLGPVCMRAVTRAAFARGATLVVAQSSQQGLPHWLELGFEHAGDYRRFLVPGARPPG
jgi:hypothetical protein